ncbi:hypothetical protein NKI51_23385 [Mesorhizobium australicum]|uniref:hypothetical protein n=1 Tax=Mesorhizobium australicum TaxID=536018 RepID=UPI00333A12AB
MATRQFTLWLQTNLPKAVYIALTLIGVVFIWVAKTHAWTASFTIVVPVAFMFTYFLITALLAGLRLHDEQAGDNLYYMGFLFTLTSLGVALYRFNVSEPIDNIVRNFGLAVVTTICGIGLRILYNQVRRDPIDIERTARHELAEMTRRVRGELEAASREFANFRRVSNQMLEEGFEEIGKQAERSGAQILKVMESLTQEAIKPIQSAGDQIKSVLDDVGTKTESRLSTASERMVSSTKTFEDANARVAETLAAFGTQVEAAGTKLAEVKTPDELISIRLKPTLTTLEKVVAAHAKTLIASDQARTLQTESLERTRQSIERVVAAIDRGVNAMEKAVEAAAHSQKVTENLERLIQQQHADLRQYIEKISDHRNDILGRKIIDAVSGRPNTEAVSPIAPSSTAEQYGSPLGIETKPQTDDPSREVPEDKRFGWFSRR